MLHEILLSLSGVPSPIWEDLKKGQSSKYGQDVSLGSLASPAEQAMVEKIAELADLHIKVRDATAIISTSHPSPICRAVSNRIKTFHLRAFVEKIIEVETSILDQDAAYVGAYKIVPLSTVVSSFQPWARPLRWLWKIVQPMQTVRHDRVQSTSSVSGADVLRTISVEARTGYTDLKVLCEDLLVFAQKAWIHSLMPWILYGRLPSFGGDDFMVQPGKPGSDCYLRADLTPYFITVDTAQTILAIGLALQQVAPKAKLAQHVSSSTTTSGAIMLDSLERVKTLQYPLQDAEISKVAESINNTISQAALSVILPKKDILDLLFVLHEYVLLRNGEFSTCLIQQAEVQLARIQAMSGSLGPVRKLGRFDGLSINEAETAVILDKTWSELSAFVPEKDSENQLRDRATDLLRLVNPLTNMPINKLLPNAASLIIQLPSGSPLSIFITTPDLERYQTLGAYLISIRRAEFQLTKLWREPSHRRCHPTPIGPPRSATRHGRHNLTVRRKREDQRNSYMRQHWASLNQVLFLISELGNYFHGEVIQRSWECLYTWLDIDANSRPTSSGLPSRPNTSSSRLSANRSALPTAQEANKRQSIRKTDPRTIARAHQRYLEALHRCLLLTNTTYTSLLSTLLNTIDHYVALFYRLQTIWTGLDLQEDESITNAFSNSKQEEAEVLAEMKRTNETMTQNIHDLVGVIRDIEEQRDLPDLSTGMTDLNILPGSASNDTFEPWRAKTLDRLLMKLDSLAGDDRSDMFEDALVDLDEE